MVVRESGFFFSSRRRNTGFPGGAGSQTCAFPISGKFTNANTKKFAKEHNHIFKDKSKPKVINDKKGLTAPSGGFAFIQEENIEVGTKASRPIKSHHELEKEYEILNGKKRKLIRDKIFNKAIILKFTNQINELKNTLKTKEEELKKIQIENEDAIKREKCKEKYNDLSQILISKQTKLRELKDELSKKSDIEERLKPLKEKIERIKEKNKEYVELMAVDA